MILFNGIDQNWIIVIKDSSSPTVLANCWYIIGWNFSIKFVNILLRVNSYDEARKKYMSMIKLL